MEIDVTRFVDEIDCGTLSASRMELGEDAGRITCRNALREAESNPLARTAEDLEKARDWLRGFGAWTRAELDSYSDQEINGMLIQFIAGDVREMEGFDSLDEYENACERGTCSGRLFESAGRWYFYVGN